MNMDLEIPRGSDYILKFEFLGDNNGAYEFSDDDLVRLEFSNIAGNITASPIDIDVEDNPASVVLPRVLLDTFESNPIKYKLILIKDINDLHLTLLTGYISLI